MLQSLFANPPEFPEEMLKKCRRHNDFTAVAFEWSKYIGVLCIKMASIDTSSLRLQNLELINIVILQGLLNRCSRLFYSIVYLGASNKFDETIRIISRCLIETLFKIKWLIKKSDSNSFKRYLRDSLAGDKEFKDIIESEIIKHSGKKLVIEERMLKSIKRCFNLAGMTTEDFSKYKRMPNFRELCKQIDYDDMAYVTMMRMGSHAIHGTWTDLLANYIEHEDDNFTLKDNNKTAPSENYYTVNNIFALDVFTDYLSYILAEQSEANKIIEIITGIKDEILGYHDESCKDDYSIL